jgi:hypothetical protein
MQGGLAIDIFRLNISARGKQSIDLFKLSQTSGCTYGLIFLFLRHTMNPAP